MKEENKVAKTYELDEFQLLVMKDEDDEGAPAIRYVTIVGGTSVKLTGSFECSEEGEQKRDEAFNKFAAKTAAEVLEVLVEMAGGEG